MKYRIEKSTAQETSIIPLFARRICSLFDYGFASREKTMRSTMELSGALEAVRRLTAELARRRCSPPARRC